MSAHPSPTPRKRKGCLRYGILFLLVLALCVGVGIAFGALQNQWLKDRVGEQLEKQFLARTGWELHIGSIQGVMPWNIHFDYAELRDQEGAWLTVRDVEASLETANLLTGRLRFDFLKVGEVTVLRKVQSQEKPSASFKFPQVPRIPPWLSLDTIELAHVHFAEAVFGKEVEFSAAASVLQLDQSGDWELQLQITGMGQTSAKAELALGMRDDVPLLTLQLEDASVLPLLLEMNAPLRLNLEGEMGNGVWNGQLKGTAGGEIFSEMTIVLQMETEPFLEATGTLALDEIPKLAMLKPFLGDSVSVDLAARLLDDNTLHIERLIPQFSNGSLFSSGTKLEGDAKLNFNASTFQAKLNYQIEDSALIGVLLGQDIQGKASGDIQIDSNTNNSYLALTINPENFASHGLVLTETQLLATFTSTGGLKWLPFPVAWDVKGNGKAAYPALAIERNVTLSSYGQWTTQNKITIDSLLIDDTNTHLEGKGDFDFTTMTGSLDSMVTVAELDAWTQIVDIPLHGQAQSKLQIFSTSDIEGLGFNLDSSFANIPGVYDEYLAVFGDSCQVNLRGQLNAGGLQVQEIRAAFGSLILNGTGVYQTKNRHLSFNADVNSETLEPFAILLNREMEGQLNAHFALQGTPDDLEFESNLKLSNLNMPPFKGSEATLESHITALPHAPQGDFHATLNDSLYGFEGGANFTMNDTQIILTEIEANAGKNNLKGEATIGRDFNSGSILVNASLPDLKPIGAILNQELSGQAKLDAEFSLERGKEPQGTLNLNASDLEAVGINFTSFDLEMNSTAKGVALSNEGKGQISATSPFDYKSAGNLEWAQKRFSLNSLLLNVNAHQGALINTAQIQLDEQGTLIFAPFSMSMDDGFINGEGSYSPSAVSLKASLQDLSLEDLADFGLPFMEGRLDAEATLSGTPKQPEIIAQLHLRDVKSQRAAGKNMPLLGVDATLDYRDGAANIQATGNAPEFIDVDANAQLPLLVSLSPFSVHYPESTNLSGTMHGTMKLDYLSYLIASESQSLAGNLLLDINLGGNWNNIVLTGNSTVTDARYENGKTGSIIEDLDIKMDVDADKIIVTHCEATDVNKGLLKGTGEIQLSLEDHFPYAFNFDLKDSHLIHRDDYKVTFNGPLKLRGNLDSCLIEGDIVTRPVWITLDMTSPAAKYKPVEYREVNGELQQNEEEEVRARVLPILVNFDLRCDIPSQLYIQTSVLDTEWKGKVHIQGTLEEPSFSGDLQSIRGQLDFLGKRFLLKDSTVNMNPENVRAPYLNVVAMTESGDVEAGVTLQGPAESFDIGLISNPALPEDEVLSQILFGRPVKDINPVQAIELARDAALLSGRFSGMGVFGISTNMPGLDALTIKTGETIQETQVGFGTFITDRFYLELLQGQVGTDASIEYRIAPGVKLKGATSFDEKSSVGLFWKRDY